MKRKNSNILLILFLILYIFLYRFVIFSKYLKYNESITSVFWILMLFLSFILLGFRKPSNDKKKKNILITILVCLGIYFILIYCSGLINGFLKNSYSRTFTGLMDNMFFLFISIVASELFRYIFISSNKDNTFIIKLFTIIMILFDINLVLRINTLKGFEGIFTFISLTVLPLSLKNIMCSYVSFYSSYKPVIIYRLIIELYVYIVPLEPDLNDYLRSVSSLILPFIIIMITSRIVSTNYEEINLKKSNVILKKADIPFVIFVLLFSFLILGIGPFKIVGIESGSMTPTLNIGDAVIINKYVDKSKLKENDIIAYKRDGVLIVHRIIKVNKDKTYETKGDYNNSSDYGYINSDAIFGKVIIKIPYLAYPAVKLRN